MFRKAWSGGTKYIHGQGYKKNIGRAQMATRIKVLMRKQRGTELGELTAQSSQDSEDKMQIGESVQILGILQAPPLNICIGFLRNRSGSRRNSMIGVKLCISWIINKLKWDCQANLKNQSYHCYAPRWRLLKQNKIDMRNTCPPFYWHTWTVKYKQQWLVYPQHSSGDCELL